MAFDENLKELLDRESARINSPEFIAEDPVQFPRRFDRQEDIEIMAFLAATIAWGRRTMICRDAERLIALMNGEPYYFMINQAYDDLDPKQNIHRTFFGLHLQYYLRGLRKIYKDFGNLDAFSQAVGADKSEAPAWKLVEEMLKILKMENGGEGCSQCLPTNLKTTALKRVNMALRWLVRDDGIVDIGIWHSIPKSKLYIPLDVHAGNTARSLGMLTRTANDRKSAEELTACARSMRPEDPTLYDFALFGLGIEKNSPQIDA